jgi:putative ABC transport system ATP-binding protein
LTTPGLPLAASGLRLAYAGEGIIDLPELSVAPGTMTALAGPSGSGKSTLLYLLSGLLRPDAGSISWAGENIASWSEPRRDRWRRQHAGFVFQNFHLIEELSPLDNVLVPLWFDRFSAAGARERATTLLEQLEVPLRRAHVSQLSRGQQQRVAIARALIGDPDVVFADEPTASLDAASGKTVTAVLRNLALVEGRTVLVATHDPALKEAATGTVMLDHGRTVSNGRAAA